jgi:hypothetical protein
VIQLARGVHDKKDRKLGFRNQVVHDRVRVAFAYVINLGIEDCERSFVSELKDELGKMTSSGELKV